MSSLSYYLIKFNVQFIVKSSGGGGCGVIRRTNIYFSIDYFTRIAFKQKNHLLFLILKKLR